MGGRLSVSGHKRSQTGSNRTHSLEVVGPRPTRSAYERGSRNPTLDTLERVLAANGQHLVSVPDLVFTAHRDRRGKSFYVPDQLPRLPVEAALGTVVLPQHVDGSPGGRPRNLADRGERMLAYQVVLAEGMPQDILHIVDGALLVDGWNDLRLPAAFRHAWQPLVDRALAGRPR